MNQEVGPHAGVRLASPRETVQARFPDGTIYEGPVGTTLESFVRAAARDEIPTVAAIVDGKLRELTYSLPRDAEVQPLSIRASDGMRIFQRSLTFLLTVAARELFPEAGIVVDHSIPLGGFFCEVRGRPPFTAQELAQIEARMREIAQANDSITREEVGVEEAIRIFQAQGYEDKVRMLRGHHDREAVTIYRLRGVSDYFYGYMVPSTGYLRTFALRPAADGFILAFPQRESPTQLPRTEGPPKLTAVFREHAEWMQVMNIEDVASLNDAIVAGRLQEIVLVSEAIHERRIAEIAGVIAAGWNRIRLVLIAGPSCAGKTTFTKRLAVQLLALGIHPVALGLDDYFVNREHTPRDEQGNFDFEALEAVDLDLFNEQLLALFEGREVTLPRFNFQAGRREPGRRLSISPEHVILVEGIHGLNPDLVPHIPGQAIFRIYVSALTQLNVDCHNRVPTSDTRLIRRIVRDAQFRGYSALKTINRWESVRRGERRYIFPYQDYADEMFNSALLYELSVLKPLVEPLLRQIKPESTQEYIEANRILSFLSWFLPAKPDVVPDNSLLSEFAGGSSLAQFSY